MILAAEATLLERGYPEDQVHKELYWPKGKEPRGVAGRGPGGRDRRRRGERRPVAAHAAVRGRAVARQAGQISPATNPRGLRQASGIRPRHA